MHAGTRQPRGSVRIEGALPGIALDERRAVRADRGVVVDMANQFREAPVLIEEDIEEPELVLHNMDIEAPRCSRTDIRVDEHINVVEATPERRGRGSRPCEQERGNQNGTDQRQALHMMSHADPPSIPGRDERLQCLRQTRQPSHTTWPGADGITQHQRGKKRVPHQGSDGLGTPEELAQRAQRGFVGWRITARPTLLQEHLPRRPGWSAKDAGSRASGREVTESDATPFRRQ